MSKVICSEHSKQRFSQRVTRKSKRFELFANRAYFYGDTLEDISDNQLRYYIEAKEKSHNSVARIYHGFIYWFSGHTLTTIYPLPRNFHGAHNL